MKGYSIYKNYEPFTGQSTLLAMACGLSLLVLNTSLATCEGLCYAIQ